MSDSHCQYDNPLIGRYASREMSELWSPQRKFSTWRRLWVALAEAEAELGLPITAEQIKELRANVERIDLAAAERHERALRHDVMAHVRSAPRPGLPGVHPPAAGPADDDRQAGVPLGLRPGAGPGGGRAPPGNPQGPGVEGDHRHAGEFP
jgi:hypothetical protein